MTTIKLILPTGKEIELTPSEARLLHTQLAELFGPVLPTPLPLTPAPTPWPEVTCSADCSTQQ